MVIRSCKRDANIYMGRMEKVANSSRKDKHNRVRTKEHINTNREITDNDRKGIFKSDP